MENNCISPKMYNNLLSQRISRKCDKAKINKCKKENKYCNFSTGRCISKKSKAGLLLEAKIRREISKQEIRNYSDPSLQTFDFNNKNTRPIPYYIYNGIYIINVHLGGGENPEKYNISESHIGNQVALCKLIKWLKKHNKYYIIVGDFNIHRLQNMLSTKYVGVKNIPNNQRTHTSGFILDYIVTNLEINTKKLNIVYIHESKYSDHYFIYGKVSNMLIGSWNINKKLFYGLIRLFVDTKEGQQLVGSSRKRKSIRQLEKKPPSVIIPSINEFKFLAFQEISDKHRIPTRTRKVQEKRIWPRKEISVKEYLRNEKKNIYKILKNQFTQISQENLQSVFTQLLESYNNFWMIENPWSGPFDKNFKSLVLLINTDVSTSNQQNAAAKVESAADVSNINEERKTIESGLTEPSLLFDESKKRLPDANEGQSQRKKIKTRFPIRKNKMKSPIRKNKMKSPIRKSKMKSPGKSSNKNK